MTSGQQLREKPNAAGEDLSSVDWVGRAKELAPVIAAAGDRIESERRVPDDVMAAMHEAELFRMCLPRSIGGGEADPITTMATAEVIASADASTAWCLGQALGCSRMAAFVDPEIAREVFAEPESVLAWGPPDGVVKAVAVDGGYRVTGTWKLASGVRNATWLGPVCRVYDDDQPRVDVEGRPVMRSMMLPIASAAHTDIWRVIGLRGTGSDAFAIDDLFVPEEYSFARDSKTGRREDGALYRMAMTTFFGIVFGGVALGVARSALDDFIGLAKDKKPDHNAVVLRENPAVQRALGETEAQLGAARCYLIDRTNAAWNCGHPADSWPLDIRARLRIAATNAVYRSRDAVAFAYQAAGSSAIFQDNPLERRFRDINTIAQQAQGQPVNFEHGGMALMGLEQKGGRV